MGSDLVCNLRCRLWREHLGAHVFNGLDCARPDFDAQRAFQAFRTTAAHNQRIYSEVFGDRIPTSEIQSVDRYHPDKVLYNRRLEDIQGNLVSYPIDFFSV